MERLLICVDSEQESKRIISYLVRVLNGSRGCAFCLFHVLPTTSPDKLRMETVQRIERIHTQRPDLEGYFWEEQDQKAMEQSFRLARTMLMENGFPEESISSHFVVEWGDIPVIILRKASELGCSTIVLGRRRLGRVKELLLGSVSSTVLRLARGLTVWVVES